VPLWLVLLGVRATALTPGAGRNLYSWCCGDAWPWDREPLLQKIAALPGKHLVIVTYDLSSYDTFEWVYNEPDIDAAQVIFARDMGPQKNRELLQYYPDRRVWRVLVRNNGASLKPIE